MFLHCKYMEVHWPPRGDGHFHTGFLQMSVVFILYVFFFFLSWKCGECYMLHAPHFSINCGFGPLPNSFSCVFWSETSEKSSGSRQNPEPRTETFPKPRPQPVFPRGEGLHIHISTGMFTTSQDPAHFLPHVFSSCDRLSFPSAA